MTRTQPLDIVLLIFQGYSRAQLPLRPPLKRRHDIFQKKQGNYRTKQFQLKFFRTKIVFRIKQVALVFICLLFPKPPIPRQEGFQHVRDQRCGIDCFAIRLRVQRGIAVEVGFQAGRASEGQLDALGLGQRPQSQFLGCAASTADLVSLIFAMMTPRKARFPRAAWEPREGKPGQVSESTGIC